MATNKNSDGALAKNQDMVILNYESVASEHYPTHSAQGSLSFL